MGEGSPAKKWKPLKEGAGSEPAQEVGNKPEKEKSPEVNQEVANLLEKMITTEPGRELLSTLQDLADRELEDNDWRSGNINLNLSEMGYVPEDAAEISGQVASSLRGEK